MDKDCRNCMFFDIYMHKEENPDKINLGYCRRYPPTIAIAPRGDDWPNSENYHFPQPNEYDWCGEWKYNEEAV